MTNVNCPIPNAVIVGQSDDPNGRVDPAILELTNERCVQLAGNAPALGRMRNVHSDLYRGPVRTAVLPHIGVGVAWQTTALLFHRLVNFKEIGLKSVNLAP